MLPHNPKAYLVCCFQLRRLCNFKNMYVIPFFHPILLWRSNTRCFVHNPFILKNYLYLMIYIFHPIVAPNNFDIFLKLSFNHGYKYPKYFFSLFLYSLINITMSFMKNHQKRLYTTCNRIQRLLETDPTHWYALNQMEHFFLITW
jgi:hypothetical protein